MTFFSELGIALFHVISAPFRQISIFWQIIPLLLMWLTLQSYFGKWKEALGWNSALANAVTLFWTIATTMQVIFHNKELFTWTKFLFLLLGMFYAIALGYVVFKHAFKEKYAFIIASPIFIYYAAIIYILWAYNLIVFNWFVLLAVIIYFLIFLGIDFGLKKILGQKEYVDELANPETKDPFNENSFEKAPETNIEEPFRVNDPMNNFESNQENIEQKNTFVEPRHMQRRKSPFS